MSLELNDIYDNLNCPICLESAEFPYECGQCAKIFCRECLLKIGADISKIKCPICRKRKSLKESAIASKLLKERLLKCPNSCGQVNLKKSNLKSHLKICTNKQFVCN